MKVKPIPEKTALPPGSMIGEMLAMQQISLSSFASALEITETDAEAPRGRPAAHGRDRGKA